MVRFILIAAACLAASPLHAQQVCRPGDPCYNAIASPPALTTPARPLFVAPVRRAICPCDCPDCICNLSALTAEVTEWTVTETVTTTTATTATERLRAKFRDGTGWWFGKWRQTRKFNRAQRKAERRQ